jgi:hypothetical protein
MVLHNEPVFLAKDITRLSAIQRAKHSILVKGVNTYRLELFEDLCFLGSHGMTNAMGGAISLTRGADGWLILARLFAGGQPAGRAQEETVVRVLAGAEAGLVWEASPDASASFYMQAGAGLRYLRFEGPDPRDHTRTATLDQALATINARLGVRLLRLYDFDMDLFAAAHIPLHLSGNEESPLFGEAGRYTPSLQVGLGVGF